MLDHSRMVRCIEDDMQAAMHHPERKGDALAQINAGVRLGYITDMQAAEYVHVLQHGARRAEDVTSPQIHRIPQHRDPAVSGRIAA